MDEFAYQRIAKEQLRDLFSAPSWANGYSDIQTASFSVNNTMIKTGIKDLSTAKLVIKYPVCDSSVEINSKGLTMGVTVKTSISSPKDKNEVIDVVKSFIERVYEKYAGLSDEELKQYNDEFYKIMFAWKYIILKDQVIAYQYIPDSKIKFVGEDTFNKIFVPFTLDNLTRLPHGVDSVIFSVDSNIFINSGYFLADFLALTSLIYLNEEIDNYNSTASSESEFCDIRGINQTLPIVSKMTLPGFTFLMFYLDDLIKHGFQRNRISDIVIHDRFRAYEQLIPLIPDKLLSDLMEYQGFYDMSVLRKYKKPKKESKIIVPYKRVNLKLTELMQDKEWFTRMGTVIADYPIEFDMYIKDGDAVLLSPADVFSSVLKMYYSTSTLTLYTNREGIDFTKVSKIIQENFKKTFNRIVSIGMVYSSSNGKLTNATTE